jgi:hypothetical protein
MHRDHDNNDSIIINIKFYIFEIARPRLEVILKISYTTNVFSIVFFLATRKNVICYIRNAKINKFKKIFP